MSLYITGWASQVQQTRRSWFEPTLWFYCCSDYFYCLPLFSINLALHFICSTLSVLGSSWSFRWDLNIICREMITLQRFPMMTGNRGIKNDNICLWNIFIIAPKTKLFNLVWSTRLLTNLYMHICIYVHLFA